MTIGPNIVGTRSWMASETIVNSKWKKKSDVQVAGMNFAYLEFSLKFPLQ